jgi:fatty-acyl-CoA synthase
LHEGPSLTPLHLADAFAAAVARSPDRSFLVAAPRRWSFAEAEREVRAAAAAFRELGVGPGERIATVLPNRPEAVWTLLAAARLGAVVVPLDPALTFPELQYQVRRADAVLMVTVAEYAGREFLEWAEALAAEGGALRAVVTVGAEDAWFAERIVPWGELAQRAGRGAGAVDARRDPEDVLAVLATSGTMGKPKGVCLSHRSLLGTAERTAAVLRAAPADVALVAVPHFTVFGTSVLLQAVLAGGTVVLLERFAPGEAVRAMGAHGVTLCHGVPTMFALLVRERGFSRTELPALRTGLIAGAPVSVDLVRRVRAVCDVEIAYGLTETGPTVTMTRPDDPAALREETVGAPIAGVEVRVQGGPAAAGEVVVRGPGLMAGYDGMPAETRRAHTEDGWFRTGDLGVLGPDGRLRIVGRQKETIIRGGWNVHPREVEDVLRAHPAVEDVCVVGVPHEILGEMICACVIPTEGTDLRGEELLAFARGRMADYKLPDLVRAVDALPLTPSGKVARRELARRLATDQPQ